MTDPLLYLFTFELFSLATYLGYILFFLIAFYILAIPLRKFWWTLINLMKGH